MRAPRVKGVRSRGVNGGKGAKVWGARGIGVVGEAMDGVRVFEGDDGDTGRDIGESAISGGEGLFGNTAVSDHVSEKTFSSAGIAVSAGGGSNNSRGEDMAPRRGRFVISRLGFGATGAFSRIFLTDGVGGLGFLAFCLALEMLVGCFPRVVIPLRVCRVSRVVPFLEMDSGSAISTSASLSSPTASSSFLPNTSVFSLLVTLAAGLAAAFRVFRIVSGAMMSVGASFSISSPSSSESTNSALLYLPFDFPIDFPSGFRGRPRLGWKLGIGMCTGLGADGLRVLSLTMRLGRLVGFTLSGVGEGRSADGLLGVFSVCCLSVS